MYSYITPLLMHWICIHTSLHYFEKSRHLFLHIGSNDSTKMTSSQIYDAILHLKEHIGDVLPSCEVFLSAPVLRLDNGNEGLTLTNLIRKTKAINVIFNDNIDGSCLGEKDLHLNPKGSGRLAINYLSQIRRLQPYFNRTTSYSTYEYMCHFYTQRICFTLQSFTQS